LKPTRKGIFQGAVSSVLFNIVISDLSTSRVKNIKPALFADDLVIWTSTPHNNRLKLHFQMNKALTKLSNWYTKNYMLINT